MDIGILLGLGVALVMILGGNAMEGGHLSSLVGIPAFMIVVGGTIGAVLVQVPRPRRRGEFKYIIFENLTCPAFKRRQLVHVLDTRADEAAAYEAEAAAARAASVAAAAAKAAREAPAAAPAA